MDPAMSSESSGEKGGLVCTFPRKTILNRTKMTASLIAQIWMFVNSFQPFMEYNQL